MTRAGAPGIALRVSVGLGSGTMLQALNSSMIAVAIVAIAADFGSTAGTSWVISALYIATAVAAPTAGKLGTVLGPRRVYLAGLALIVVGSLVGSFAPNLGWLVAARILLGLGTASQYPTAMTMLRTIAARTGAQVRSAVAVLTVCAQTTVALGPTIGGILVAGFGWQSIMWINVPMVLVTLVWVLRVTEPDPPVRLTGSALVRAIDPPGLLGFLAVVTATMFLLLSLSTDPLWWLLAVVAVAGGAVVWWERRAAAPFLDVRALGRNRTLTLTLLRTTATYTAFYCVFFGLPQWLQVSRGFSASTAGLLMLPVAMVGVVSTLAASRTVARYGARRTLLLGTVGLVAGGALLALVEGEATSVPVLVLVACVLGIPNGFNNMGNQSVVNSATSVAEVGPAIGMYRTVQYIGANLAAVAIELSMHSGIDDAGLHRVGLTIVVIGVVLVVGVLASRSLRAVDLRSAARARIRDRSQTVGSSR